MMRRLVHATVCGVAAWLILCSASSLFAADKPVHSDGDRVSGIVINTQPGWINVKADGDQKPTRYRIDKADEQLAESLKGVVQASRVQLTFKAHGEERRLVGIRRIAPNANGTVTGEVVHNHGWWIELKPGAGVPECYACPFPSEDHPEMLAKLKGLKPGEWVTVGYTTDAHRHRIQTLHAAPRPAAPAPKRVRPAAQAPTDASGHKVAGILVERSESWVKVKADGEDEPVRYTVDASNKLQRESLKSIFDACRVNLSYTTAGESRQLLTIDRQILHETGTITGDVVMVHNNFWVEVKPRDGLPDAFAPGASNYCSHAFMDRLRGLKPGDSVTISYNTDFERHRITSLKVNSHAAATTPEK